ncbi:hypothetical protein ISF_07522 [Cordyceps fumosorosea ARSEF 2679]|uniref:Uncharacterized protein n=1 Tax=Cordyceps fumosorosea (strain ARSEF 2679) TaxID=1081104 RepID=A0A167PAD5_CORFA|nr:hypothetical protein ISF_07522 [Cordyceps fumosorosea ARSEF 2679]OAA56454.1 hypothetical protein ISF_07522 [Cordyceps fumosorosea ARSEF 2679]
MDGQLNADQRFSPEADLTMADAIPMTGTAMGGVQPDSNFDASFDLASFAPVPSGPFYPADQSNLMRPWQSFLTAQPLFAAGQDWAGPQNFMGSHQQGFQQPGFPIIQGQGFPSGQPYCNGLGAMGSQGFAFGQGQGFPTGQPYGAMGSQQLPGFNPNQPWTSPSQESMAFAAGPAPSPVPAVRAPAAIGAPVVGGNLVPWAYTQADRDRFAAQKRGSRPIPVLQGLREELVALSTHRHEMVLAHFRPLLEGPPSEHARQQMDRAYEYLRQNFDLLGSGLVSEMARRRDADQRKANKEKRAAEAEAAAEEEPQAAAAAEAAATAEAAGDSGARLIIVASPEPDVTPPPAPAFFDPLAPAFFDLLATASVATTATPLAEAAQLDMGSPLFSEPPTPTEDAVPMDIGSPLTTFPPTPTGDVAAMATPLTEAAQPIMGSPLFTPPPPEDMASMATPGSPTRSEEQQGDVLIMESIADANLAAALEAAMAEMDPDQEEVYSRWDEQLLQFPVPK